MRRFRCPSCQHEVFFSNTACLNCGTVLIYKPGAGFSASTPDAVPCANRDSIGCNWIAADGQDLCVSCAHTIVVPDLGVEGNLDRWARIEAAKRPVMRALFHMGLPLRDTTGAPAPVFKLKGDPLDPDRPRVLTGHDSGTITLNIEEADDDQREAMRSAMGEPYRTLSGHFRHEVGHHYWALLTEADPRALETLRAVFGDDRQDYGEALAAHYRDGPPADWEDRFISAYASAHPWEDFAETWAHVMHLLDGIETARAFGLIPADLPVEPADLLALPMARLAEAWIELSIALNAVNQAMGHETFYPFVLNGAVIEKMDAIRRLIVGSRLVEPRKVA
ncbi:zinc-binding metallopeptidase family protein [Pararhodobacter marinus]|uniref:zinc-binding metallopeptidase family protein n=1 Tax=Pararhodobacter marinus TaxID=2184063 RepID=UPI00351584E3